MENPASWGKAEHVVAAAIKDYNNRLGAGVIGSSMVAMITAALRREGLLNTLEPIGRAHRNERVPSKRWEFHDKNTLHMNDETVYRIVPDDPR